MALGCRSMTTSMKTGRKILGSSARLGQGCQMTLSMLVQVAERLEQEGTWRVGVLPTFRFNNAERLKSLNK
jgi:hypothetical protein